MIGNANTTIKCHGSFHHTPSLKPIMELWFVENFNLKLDTNASCPDERSPRGVKWITKYRRLQIQTQMVANTNTNGENTKRDGSKYKYK